MTIKDLKKWLNDRDDNAEVYVCSDSIHRKLGSIQHFTKHSRSNIHITSEGDVLVSYNAGGTEVVVLG